MPSEVAAVVVLEDGDPRWERMGSVRLKFASENGGGNGSGNSNAGWDIHFRTHQDRRYLNSVLKDQKRGYYITVGFDHFLRAMTQVTDLRLHDIRDVLCLRQYELTDETDDIFPSTGPTRETKFGFGMAGTVNDKMLVREECSWNTCLKSQWFHWDTTRFGICKFLPGEQVYLGIEAAEGNDPEREMARFMRQLCKAIVEDHYRQWLDHLAMRVPSLYVPETFASRPPWKIVRSPIQSFALEDVRMDPEQRDRIVRRMKRVYETTGDHDDDERYSLLLNGPSGSGKTCLVMALAAHFRADVYKIGPGDDMASDRLEELIFRLHLPDHPVILLLENVDQLASRTERSPIEPGILMDLLQGLTAPLGTVVIMTTSRVKSIDPAIIRPGRTHEVCNLRSVDKLSDDELTGALRSFVDRTRQDHNDYGQVAALCRWVREHRSGETRHVSLAALFAWIERCAIEKKSIVQEHSVMKEHICLRSLPAVLDLGGEAGKMYG